MAKEVGFTGWRDLARSLIVALAVMLALSLPFGHDWRDLAPTWIGFALMFAGLRVLRGRRPWTAARIAAPVLLMILGGTVVVLGDGDPVTFGDAVVPIGAAVGTATALLLAARTERDRGLRRDAA